MSRAPSSQGSRRSAATSALHAARHSPDAEGAKLRTLLSAIRELSGEIELDVLLKRAMAVCTRLADADRSSLFLYDRERNELWSKIAQGLDTLELRFPAGEGLAGQCAKGARAINVDDAYQDEHFNREFDRKTGYRTRSVLCVPMLDAHGGVLGVIQVLNKSGGETFTTTDEEFLQTLGSHVAAFIENAQLYESIERLFESVVRATSTAIDERDPATAGHTRRVARYALNLARAAHEAGLAEFTRERLKQLRYAALLHDVGKIGVRESVLMKKNRLTTDRMELVAERLRRVALGKRLAGSLDETVEFLRRANSCGFLQDEDLKRVRELADEGLVTPEECGHLSVRRGNLTPDEWDDMKSHTDRSLNILSKIPWPEKLAAVPRIAHRHHEKLDGSGYPRGLHEKDIGTDARILEVVDIYDALTARDRPYKPAMPHAKACAILKEEAAAGKLDADLVDLFVKRRLHEVDLGTGTRIISQAG